MTAADGWKRTLKVSDSLSVAANTCKTPAFRTLAIHICIYIYIYGSIHLIVNPSVHVKKIQFGRFPEIEWQKDTTSVSSRNVPLEQHAAFSQQAGLQQPAEKDRQRTRRHSTASPAETCSTLYFFVRTWGRHLIFFSVPVCPTHAETLLNATTADAQINRNIRSEWVCICNWTRQTIKDRYGYNAEAPSSRGGLLLATASWSRLGWPCWGVACPAG